MNCLLAIAFILLAPIASFAQAPFFGLFSNHYQKVNAFTGENQRVNKPLGIIYSRDYCWIISPNGDKIGFPIITYTKTANTSRHSIHESFLSGECRTTTQGFYTIMVDQMDDGYTFQIADPTGTMIATHAQRYSENGPVPAMKIDWKALRQEAIKRDTIHKAADTRTVIVENTPAQQARIDSTLRALTRKKEYHDSLLQVAYKLHLYPYDGLSNENLIEIIEKKRKQDAFEKQ